MEDTKHGGDKGMERTMVWRGQAHGWGHGYGGDNGIEVTWVWRGYGYGGDTGMG